MTSKRNQQAQPVFNAQIRNTMLSPPQQHFNQDFMVRQTEELVPAMQGELRHIPVQHSKAMFVHCLLQQWQGYSTSLS